MNVFVAVYNHRFGTDIAVFSTPAGAHAFRDNIAIEWWDHEFPDDVMPEENVGDAYFDMMCDKGSYVEDCEIFEKAVGE